jgi:hypothetical protein
LPPSSYVATPPLRCVAIIAALTRDNQTIGCPGAEGAPAPPPAHGGRCGRPAGGPAVRGAGRGPHQQRLPDHGHRAWPGPQLFLPRRFRRRRRRCAPSRASPRFAKCGQWW